MFWDIRELPKVFELYHKMKDVNVKPNKMICGYVLQAAMKKQNTAMTIEVLEKFIEIKHEPDNRLL